MASGLYVDGSSTNSLAPIDGLIAAARFYDEAQDSHAHLLHEGDDIPMAHVISSANNPYHPRPAETPRHRIPRDPPVNARLLNSGSPTYRLQWQWDALRQFRRKTNESHERAAKLSDSFRQRWPSASSMRQCGLLVMRDICCAEVPTSALDLFAAVIVQHAIYDVHDVQCNTNRCHSAVSAWRDRVERLAMPVEREEIAFLYDHLFPEDVAAAGPLSSDSQDTMRQSLLLHSQAYLEVGGQFDGESRSAPIPIAPRFQSQSHAPAPTTITTNPVPQFGPGLMWQQSLAGRNVQQAASNYAPNSWFNTGGYPNHNVNPLVMTMDPGFPMSMDMSPPAIVLTPDYIYEIQSIYPEPTPSSASSNKSHLLQQQSTIHGRLMDAGIELKESAPFKIFLKFIQDLSRPNNLLDLFSTDKVKSSPVDTPAQLTTSLSICRYKEQLRLFDPLTSLEQPIARNPIVRGILSATELMIFLGNLRCLRHVEDYLMALGQQLIVTHPTFRNFATEILRKCQRIANEPGSRQFCYRNVMHEDNRYSEQSLHEQLRRLSIQDQGNCAPKELIDDDLARNHLEVPSQTASHRTTSWQSGSQDTSLSNVQPTSPFEEAESQADSAASSQHFAGTNQSSKVCFTCGKKFTGKWANTSLSRHTRTDHSRQTLYECPYCHKVDKRSCNLSKHIEKIHPGMIIPKFGKKGIQRLPPA